MVSEETFGTAFISALTVWLLSAAVVNRVYCTAETVCINLSKEESL